MPNILNLAQSSSRQYLVNAQVTVRICPITTFEPLQAAHGAPKNSHIRVQQEPK